MSKLVLNAMGAALVIGGMMAFVYLVGTFIENTRAVIA